MKTTSRNVSLFGGGLLEATPRPQRGTLLYDAACPACAGMAFHLRGFLAHYNVRLAPIQTPWVMDLLHERGLDPLLEIRLLKSNGALLGGADAILALAGAIWWAKPIRWSADALHLRPLLRRAYAAVAKRRHCLNGVCKLHHAPI